MTPTPQAPHPADQAAGQVRAQHPEHHERGGEAAALDIAQDYAVPEAEARRRYHAAWTRAQDRPGDPEAPAEAAFWLGYTEQLTFQLAQLAQAAQSARTGPEPGR